MTSSSFLTPEWEQLGIPVDDEAEPEDAQPEHKHGAEDDDGS